ncbi:hypothetical protein CHU98_g7082 [Xylaria longipes]|nr:hypothetical protein CHU98_g7082 [Xylaria longipes]
MLTGEFCHRDRVASQRGKAVQDFSRKRGDSTSPTFAGRRLSRAVVSSFTIRTIGRYYETKGSVCRSEPVNLAAPVQVKIYQMIWLPSCMSWYVEYHTVEGAGNDPALNYANVYTQVGAGSINSSGALGCCAAVRALGGARLGTKDVAGGRDGPTLPPLHGNPAVWTADGQISVKQDEKMMVNETGRLMTSRPFTAFHRQASAPRDATHLQTDGTYVHTAGTILTGCGGMRKVVYVSWSVSLVSARARRDGRMLDDEGGFRSDGTDIGQQELQLRGVAPDEVSWQD